MAQHGRAQQRALILVDQVKIPGPVLLGGQEILDLGCPARGHDRAPERDHAPHFVQVSLVIERVALEQTQEHIFARGLQGQLGKAGRLPLEAVAAALQKGHVRRDILVQLVNVLAPQKVRQHGRDILFKELFIGQLPAEHKVEPLERDAPGVEHEKGHPAIGEHVATDVKVARVHGPVDAHARDLARPIDVIDIPRSGQSPREGGQDGVVPAAQDTTVPWQPEF